MKILVTGGAGFIASHVVDLFIREGHEVAIIDNLTTGLRQNLNPKATFYEMDIRDPGIEAVFEREQPDVIDHHAAQIDVRKSVEDPAYDADVNILGSINLIQCCIATGVKKFIYISTGGAVYGEPETEPLDESHPVNPLSCYGISKHTVEHYLFQAGRVNGLNYTILRYPNVYGPRQNPKGEAGVNSIFISKMLKGEIPTIYGKGHECRDYLYVGDAAAANLLVLDKGDREIFNLGTGVGTSVPDLYRNLSEIIGVNGEAHRAPLRPGEVERIILDSGKIRKALGWQARVSLREGLQNTVAFFREHPEML